MMFHTQVITGVTVGERLARKRRDLRLSLGRAAQKLTVRACYLEALERSQYKYLPPLVYAKGLLQRYTDLLGIPREEIIRMFEREYEAYLPGAGISMDTFYHVRPRRLFHSRTRLSAVMISILFLCATLYLSYYLYGLIGVPSLAITIPERDFVTEQESLALTGNADRNTVITINGKETSVRPDSTFREEIQLRDGLNTIHIVATTRFGRQTEEVRRVIRRHSSGG
ncbi:MAG: helix-turn-helix domain-containing protein [Parcubacteria group bacterium]|nr:helix-turn-helix domain-containing protein [Parcubacteria group bacterium]